MVYSSYKKTKRTDFKSRAPKGSKWGCLVFIIFVLTILLSVLLFGEVI